MSEDTGASFLPGARRNFARDNVADAAEPKFAFFRLSFYLLSVLRPCAFGHQHKKTEIAGGITRSNSIRHFLKVEGNFGNQNDIRTTSQSTMKRDPARVTPHHFNDDGTFVAGRGRVKSIQRVHHGINGGIETECHRRRLEIVIDGFRNAHTIYPSLLQLECSGHRSVTADDN